MMFDLTNTPLAQAPTRQALPSENELTAVAIALVLMTWCRSDELSERVLSFSEMDVEVVLRLIQQPLASFPAACGQGGDLPRRLRQLVGLRVSLSDACNPIFT